VSWAIEQKGYSQRGACRLVGMHAKTYRYCSRRADDSTTGAIARTGGAAAPVWLSPPAHSAGARRHPAEP
jgi:hypothetical protein